MYRTHRLPDGLIGLGRDWERYKMCYLKIFKTGCRLTTLKTKVWEKSVSTNCIWKSQLVISRCSKKNSFSKSCMLEETLKSLTLTIFSAALTQFYLSKEWSDFLILSFTGGEGWLFSWGALASSIFLSHFTYRTTSHLHHSLYFVKESKFLYCTQYRIWCSSTGCTQPCRGGVFKSTGRQRISAL